MTIDVINKGARGDGVPMKLAGIMNATHWLPSGEIWAKHEWDLMEIPSDLTGYCGGNGGFWSIYPSRDFFGDSYPRYTKGGNYDNLFIPHLESKYNQAPLTVKVDKDFEKIYGPICYYINDGANVEEMWVDAKRQAQIQKGQWPYKWLDIDKYHDRGSVKGRLSISDGQSPVGAYVILANPDGKKTDEQQIHIWMRNYGPYQYYLEITDPDGNFEIPNVHSGSYDFFVFKPGMIGEMRIDDIEVAKGKSATLGNITLQKHDKGRTLWQIGIPDGTMTEFKNGKNGHQWDNMLRYGMDFPNDVHYVVGKSADSVDWNNLHMATVDGKFKPVTWTIEYELDDIPDGEVVLMMVCSGRADLDVIANGKKVGDLKIEIGGHGRTMLISESTAREFVIEKDILKVGKNTIKLTWAKGLADNPAAADKKRRDIYGHIAYDFLRLEVRDQ